MLALTGFSVIVVIIVLLLTQRGSPIIALAGVPLVGAAAVGLSAAEISEFVSGGIGGIVGVVAMFIFAIIFFGVLRDAGMFDPIVDRIVRFAGDKPATITLATTLLAIVTHLDGAGVMNVIPWGGPTLRAAATAEVPANELWVPLIPAQIVGLLIARGRNWNVRGARCRNCHSAALGEFSIFSNYLPPPSAQCDCSQRSHLLRTASSRSTPWWRAKSRN